MQVVIGSCAHTALSNCCYDKSYQNLKYNRNKRFRFKELADGPGTQIAWKLSLLTELTLNSKYSSAVKTLH